MSPLTGIASKLLTGSFGGSLEFSADSEISFMASDGALGDLFGQSVAVGSGRIVVGAWADDDNGSASGSAYIYNLDGTNEIKITPSDGAANQFFGREVAIGDNKIVVGAIGDDDNGSNSGSAYIYDLDGTNEVKITASDGAADDNFGYSVAIGNGRIVVGAPFNDDNGSASGSVYIYDLDGTNEVKITPSDGAANDNFGSPVAIGDDKVVVGVWRKNSNTGAIYIYDLNGTNEIKVTASDIASTDGFGRAVAIGDNKIVAGSIGDDDNDLSSGSAYIYDLDGTNEVKITASDGALGDLFGNSVAVGNGRIVVGAYQDDDNGANSGSVYIYDLDGTQLAKITASDAGEFYRFGTSVSIGNRKLVVGSPNFNSNLGKVYVYG